MVLERTKNVAMGPENKNHCAGECHQKFTAALFFSMTLPDHSGPRPLIQIRNHFYTGGRTPWTSDQLVARPLPKQKTTQTQNKRIHTPNIYALSGIRTHDPSVRASEDSSFLRPRCYCDRLCTMLCSILILAKARRKLLFCEKLNGLNDTTICFSITFLVKFSP
jgi:hypothetical protein